MARLYRESITLGDAMNRVSTRSFFLLAFRQQVGTAKQA